MSFEQFLEACTFAPNGIGANCCDLLPALECVLSVRIINCLGSMLSLCVCSSLKMEAERTAKSLDPYRLNDFNSLLYWLKIQETFYEHAFSVCCSYITVQKGSCKQLPYPTPIFGVKSEFCPTVVLAEDPIVFLDMQALA